MAIVNVRYIVDDVAASVDFYTRHFGFAVDSNAAPAFAAVTRGDLRLLLSGETSSAGRPMPDGRRPEPRRRAPGPLVVTHLTARGRRGRGAGAPVRTDMR